MQSPISYILSPSSGPTNSLVPLPHSLLSHLTETPQCPAPYFLPACLPSFGFTSILDHIIHVNPLSPSPSTSVLLPHLPGIAATPDKPPQFAFSVLTPVKKIAPLDRLLSPSHCFQLQMHFPGFFIILSLVSGQLLLPFSSITVPIFTTFPNPAIDISFPHSWTFRTVPGFCHHKKKPKASILIHIPFLT